MDDKTTQELNALEQAILNDPVNYLNTEHEPRTWNLSTTDLARSVSITPESILSTSRERFGPEKESIAETALKELWRGFKGTVQTIADGTTEDYARTVLYRSPNIRKEDADRIMDDIINSGYIAREAENVRRAESIHDPFTAGISNGIGSMIYLALVGATTRSPLAVGAIAGTSEAYSAREEMIDSYVREQGSAKDVSKKLGEFNGKAIAYGAFAGAVEMSIGVERLAAGAVRRYTKLDALSRLARQQGKYGKSAVIRAAKEFGTTGAEEAGEEFLQSIGQDVSTQGFTEAFTDENFKKALTQAMYGGIIGGPSGAAFYYVGRKMTIDKINEWNKENNIGLTEQQVVNVADEIIDNGTHQMADEIATRAELQLHYGQAFETVKQKIKDVITGTETTPWTDETKTIDEYADTVAKTITLPMILQANKAKLPLSEFLDVVKMHVVQGTNGPTPILQLEPIEDIDQLKAMLEEQKAIVKEQKSAAKLGIATPGAEENARRRQGILEYRIRELEAEQKVQKARTTRRRENADYITAKDLQPEQTTTIDTAQTAEVGQDFVLIAGKRIPVEYQVVDLSEIQPSHIDGEANPNYTNKELQNRASRGTTQDVADLREKAQNITPERLLRAVTSAEGAPLVNAQGEVIAGNGRAEIVRYAYENPETAEKYRTALEQAGFSTEGMERPILVRRNTSMTPEEQIAAADISNISETSAFDEASQARRDSKFLADSATPLEFAGKIPMSERRGMMQNNGKWNMRRVNDRYEAALLSWLCGNDTQLFEALVLDGKLTHKVLDVLTANGNLIYEIATKYPDTQLREDLYHALVKMQVADRNNFLEITQQIEIDGRDVMVENVFVWAWLYTDTTTNRQMLRNYATKLSENHEQVANGQDMFGDQVAPLSNKDAMMQALKTTDEERAQAAAQQGKEYQPLFSAETGEIKNAELASAIASYQNQFAISTNTEGGVYHKIAYTSGKTFYLTPSTRFVLRGGEGQIVHGWGLYLLENMLENARLYRNKFNSGLIYVENMPEENKVDQIIAYNGLVGENAKKFKEYLSYVLENKPGWTEKSDNPYVADTIAWLANITEYVQPLINEKTTPVTAYFHELATHDWDDPRNLYIKRKDGQAHFVVKKNLPKWVKDVLTIANRNVDLKGWSPYYALYTILESRESLARQLVSSIFSGYNVPFVLKKAMQDYTESILGRSNLEPRTTKTPRVAPTLPDEENVQLYKKSYFLGPLSNAIRNKQVKDAPTRARLLIELLKDIDAEYKADHEILFTASYRGHDRLGPTQAEANKGSTFIQNIYEQAKEDYNTDSPTYEQINAVFVTTIENQSEWWQHELLPKHLIQEIYGEGISEEFENTAREYIVDMVMKGTDPFQPAQPYRNIDLEQTTSTILDSDHLSTYIPNLADTVRRIYDGKTGNLDEIVTMMPKTYGGFWGLYALVETHGTSASADTKLMRNIATGQTTFENLDEQETYKELQTQKIPVPAFLVSVLERAKKIYKANTDKNSAPDVKTWGTISDAIKTITDKEKEILTKESGMNDKDKELFFKILTNPEGVKKTRGQQLEIEIPNADELLNEEQFLADQASAPKIREFLRDFATVADDPTQYLEKGGQSLKDNAYAIKLGVTHKTISDWTDEVREVAFDLKLNETDITPEKRAEVQKKVDDWVGYIMEHMRGENLYRFVMDTLPDMIAYLSDGTEIGGDIGIESDELYDPDKNPTFYVLGNYVTAQNAKETSMWLNDFGIKGITYRGGTDGRGYVIFSDEAVKTLRRIDDEQPMYYKKANMQSIGVYDKELQTIVLGKAWDEVTLVHEFHHRYLQKIWEIYQQAQAGTKTVTPEWLEDTRKLFEMLEINPNQDGLTTVQQEKFAYMVEAYITGLGVENQDNLAFQGFLHWVPEKYTSIMSIGYLDENGIKQNPYLDEESIAFFNRWFASPFVPSLPSSPDAERMVNPTNEDGEPIPSNQKVMNNREKEWGQDSEKQNKADAQLWRAIGENNPSTIRAQMDGEKEIMKAEADNNPDDRVLPEKPKLRDKWFHARQPDARETAAEAARAYVNNNPDHARELAFADPETMTEYDAPVDQGMLIRAVMETVQKGSDEWYILDNNLAMVKSMSGSTLSLSGDLSHQAYLDAKREVEEARELKAAVNYAGTSRGAMEKWQSDINKFIAARVGSIIATTPNSKEREVAIKAFLEEAKTKFSGNTTNAILNKYDFTGYTTKDTGAFIKWAEKQIKEAAHAKIDTKEQAELMKASIAAQVALKGINSTEQKDGNFVRAVQSAKDIRHWQFVKDKMKKAYIGRWGKFGIWVDNVLGGYMPSAMLMSANTLFFANVPSTAINTAIVQQAVKLIGENNVDEKIQKDERKRIRQVFNGSGMNLAQMEKPTSPSLMHGEKYTNQEQVHWYNFTFDILGREDNWFRIPTFVDALARIATKNANGNKAKANQLFREYSELGNKNEDAQMARKEALAVANMAVFTQDGIMASALNHIRSQINTATRRLAGLEPGGFGLGNLLAPFLKTGANIVEMGLTSTIAPIRTIGYGLKKLQGKQIPDVDKIALATDWAYFALTAVAVALMAAISGDDDDWYEKPYQTGRKYDPNKPYDSIRFGNTWIKLDIFGPWEIPLRTAAILVQDWEKKKMAAIGEGLYEALSETPLVNQFVDNQMDYMQRNPEKYWPSFAYNQVNKLVPAQIKSLTRAGSRLAGTELDVSGLGQTVERKFHRNYGLDGAQLTTNDLLNILTNRLKYNPQ